MKTSVRLISILVLFFCLSLQANATSYSESTAISKFNEATNKSTTVIRSLTSWSNTYSGNLKQILTKSFVTNFTDNTNTNLTLIINELKAKGYTSASNSLKTIKNSYANDITIIESDLNIVLTYLNDNKANGVVGSTDLFIAMRSDLRLLKPYLTNLINIYYESDYNEIIAKTTAADNETKITAVYDYVINKYSIVDVLLSKYQTKMNNWQTVYNNYYLDDFNVRYYFNSIFDRLNADANTIYNKINTKSNSILTSQINTIEKNVDRSNTESVINHNTKLNNLIDKLSTSQINMNNSFNKTLNALKINSFETELNNYKTKYNTMMKNMINKAKGYLIAVNNLEVKNTADKTKILISNSLGTIVYSNNIINSNSFMNLLNTSYGNISVENTYNGNIGTKSLVVVNYNNQVVSQYILIVKGDVTPSGKVDISDIVKVCNKMFNKVSLDSYLFEAADMDNDGKIDITDIVKICNIIFSK